MISRKNKRAAVEMSVGTIVTIVLLMTVLILGLVLVRTIFTSSVENINSIDQAVKTEINKLFSEDDSRKIVVYPPTREITIRKGEQGGFGFSIRNTESIDQEFRYIVSYSGDNSCNIASSLPIKLIILGDQGNQINIKSGETLENPVLVKFDVSDSPVCEIRYNLDVYDQNNELYSSTISIDVKVIPE